MRPCPKGTGRIRKLRAIGVEDSSLDFPFSRFAEAKIPRGVLTPRHPTLPSTRTFIGTVELFFAVNSYVVVSANADPATITPQNRAPREINRDMADLI